MLGLTAIVAFSIATFIKLRETALDRSNTILLVDSYSGVYGYRTESHPVYRSIMMKSGVDERAFWEPKHFTFGPHCAGYDRDFPFDDEKLIELSGKLPLFPRLAWLDFASCENVTDAGISSIPKSPNLEYIQLRGTSVTDSGVAQLQKRLPGVELKR